MTPIRELALSSRSSWEFQDLDWLIPFSIITAIQLALWGVLVRIGFAPVASFTLEGRLFYFSICAMMGLCYYVWFVFKLVRTGEPDPIGQSLSAARSNTPRILAAFLAVWIAGLQSVSFTALKSAIPAVDPFWFDPYAAAAGRAIFGRPSWEVSHGILGWATPELDFIYATWIPVQFISFYALVTSRPSVHKSRCIITLTAAWPFIGLLMACGLSSAGPVFYDHVYHSTLFAQLDLSRAPIAHLTSIKLWTYYTAGTAQWGSGISAMPSMHVGLAFWLVLVFRHSRFVWLAWAYYMLIWIGSFHLGWHYFIDGPVASLGVMAIWKMTAILLPERGSTETSVGGREVQHAWSDAGC